MNNNINDIDQPPHYVISNEHYLRILFEYLPRELDSINRLTSKSFNRVLIDINNNKFITGHGLVEYLITNGMIKLFDFVKESGCKFESKDLCNVAARNGQIDCLIHLRSKGYHCDESALMNAAEGGHLQMVLELLDRGANVNAILAHRMTTLMAASQHGRIGVVRELLNRGADINTASDNGRNSLMHASQGGHIEVVRELLDRGSDINARSISGWNSLMYASRYGYIEVVHELLNRGADINTASDDGRNSLMHASQEGHIEVVRELLNRGADTNAIDNDGSTALLLARSGRQDLVRLLEQASKM